MSAPGPPILSKSHPSQIKPKARDQQITYYWSPPASDGGSPIIYYILSIANYTSFIIYAPSTSYTVTGLTNGQEYTGSVASYNAIGESPYATFRTVQPGFKPDPPTNVLVTPTTSSTALISWTAPTNTGQASIKWNVVKAVSDNISDPVIRLSTYDYSTEWLVKDLNSASTYTFTVYAVNDPGYSVGASAQNIVQSGLLLWLDATSYSGSNAWSNLTGNSAFDATIEYGTIAKNTAGNGIVLDGYSSWEFPDIGSQTNWTLSVWFKQTGTPGNAYPAIVTQCYNNAANMYIWTRPEYNEKFVGGFFDGGNNYNDGIQYTFPLNVWKNMAVTWDGTNYNLKTYINGTLIDTTTYPEKISVSSGQKYRIGHRWDQLNDPSYFVTGEIGEVLIYNRALSAEEVTHNYNITSPTYPPFNPSDLPNLLIWLDMADSSAFTTSGGFVNSIIDKSGNGNTMNQIPPNSIDPPPGFTSVFPVPGTTINGLTTAYFSAYAGIKLTDSAELTGVTDFFWVGRQDTQGGNLSFFLGHDVNYDWHGAQSNYISNSAQPGVYNATATIFANGSPTTDTFINISIVATSTTFMISVRGITGNTRFQGLCYDRDIWAGWIGDFGELICYNSALTNDQFATVQNYLRNKWNI